MQEHLRRFLIENGVQLRLIRQDATFEHQEEIRKDTTEQKTVLLRVLPIIHVESHFTVSITNANGTGLGKYKQTSDIAVTFSKDNIDTPYI